MYTILRAGVHFTGAFAMPAAGALASSLAMHGIEGIANWGIDKYNQKHPEKEIAPFEINPKVKNAVKFLSSAAVGIAYSYGTLGYEADQLLKTGNIQYEQYAADILGSLGGTFAFHKLDIKDTFGSCANLLWNSGKALSKTINGLEEKITSKIKGKNTPEQAKGLTLEDIAVDSNFEHSSSDKPHVWDLNLYKDSEIGKEFAESTTIPAQTSKTTNIQTDDKTSKDDEINI